MKQYKMYSIIKDLNLNVNNVNMNKTLIGKNDYLFLINDSCKELEIHNNNTCLVDKNFYLRYENIKEKMLFVVFPNKSFIYSQFLPDIYKLKYRSGFDMYKQYFGNHIMDGYDILKNIDDTYFKTDTHINNNGGLIIYNSFIDKANELFNFNIPNKKYTLTKEIVGSLSELGLGIGDLTLANNLGSQQLNCKKDTYYTINESSQLYMKYVFYNNSQIRLLLKQGESLIDCTMNCLNTTLDWDKLGTYILFKKNDTINSKHKIVIFYDSFLTSTLQLYMELFYEVYFIKSIYDNAIINLINPDYVFEFRVERFLL
jgi:hypothetical protein